MPSGSAAASSRSWSCDAGCRPPIADRNSERRVTWRASSRCSRQSAASRNFSDRDARPRSRVNFDKFASRSLSVGPLLRMQLAQSALAAVSVRTPRLCIRASSTAETAFKQATAPCSLGSTTNSQARNARSVAPGGLIIGRDAWPTSIACSGQAGAQSAQPSQISESNVRPSSSNARADSGQAATQALHCAMGHRPCTHRSASIVGFNSVVRYASLTPTYGGTAQLSVKHILQP